MKNIIGIWLLIVAIICSVFGCSNNNSSKQLPKKTTGLYLNYIDAAKKYHEGKYKGINTYDYENVVYEAVTKKSDAEQTKDSLPIYECIVTFVADNSSKKSLKNYLLQVTRDDFSRAVKRWMERTTDYATQLVDNQKYVEENGRTTRDHDAELKIGFEGIEVGGKINLGAIVDDSRKTTEAVLMTLESMKNDIVTKDINEQKLIQNMTDEQYLYSLGYYSQYYNPIIKELTVDEVIKKYKNIEDTDNEILYQKLVDDNKNNISDEVVEDVVETKSKYETYIEENQIKKMPSAGLNSQNEKTYYINNYKIKIPDYYVNNYYTYFSNYDYSLVKYDNKTSNKKSEIIIMSNKNSSDYLDYNYLTSEKENGDLQKEIESILSSAGITKIEFDDKIDEIKIPSSYGYLYTFVNDVKYGEVLVFVDDKAKGFTYIIFVETIDGQTEYKSEYTKIRENIDAIKFLSLQKENDYYVQSGMTPTEVESELRSFGFKNVSQRPTTEFEEGGGIFDKAQNLFKGWTKKNIEGKNDSEVLFKVELKIDGRWDSAYEKGDYPENTEILVWFFSDDKAKQYHIQEEQEEIEKAEEEERIRNEQYELENLSNSGQNDDIDTSGINYIDLFDKANKKISSGIICNKDFVVTEVVPSSIAEKIGIKLGDTLNNVMNTYGESELNNHFKIVSKDRAELTPEEQYEIFKSDDYEREIVGDKTETLLIEIKKQIKLKTEEYQYLLDFKNDNYYDDINAGVILREYDYNYVVDKVNPNSIAYNAGLKENDTIIEIDGDNYEGAADAGRVAELREIEGTTMQLKVRRNVDGVEELIDIEINYLKN